MWYVPGLLTGFLVATLRQFIVPWLTILNLISEDGSYLQFLWGIFPLYLSFMMFLLLVNFFFFLGTLFNFFFCVILVFYILYLVLYHDAHDESTRIPLQDYWVMTTRVFWCCYMKSFHSSFFLLLFSFLFFFFNFFYQEHILSYTISRQNCSGDASSSFWIYIYIL
jgi:hypothetical protein